MAIENRDTIMRSFRKIYPEFRGYIIGETNDGEAIVSAEFPDGTFYFQVTENSVSTAYNSLEDAKR